MQEAERQVAARDAQRVAEHEHVAEADPAVTAGHGGRGDRLRGVLVIGGGRGRRRRRGRRGRARSNRFAAVDLDGHQVSWLVPVVGLSLIAYVAGIAAPRRVGPRLARSSG